MIKIDIPNRTVLNIENIIFDFNGTLALDGKLSMEIKESLIKLSKLLNIYILTADTNNSVSYECRSLPVTIVPLKGGSTTVLKEEFLQKIGFDKTIAVGNGANDIKMLENSILSFAVIGSEGCFFEALSSSKVIVNKIEDVFGALFNLNRLIATLRD